MLPVDQDGPRVLQTGENLGVEHGGREGTLAPLFEHLDQGICEGIPARVGSDGIPARGRDGLGDALAGRESGAGGSGAAIEKDQDIRDGSLEEGLDGRPSVGPGQPPAFSRTEGGGGWGLL